MKNDTLCLFSYIQEKRNQPQLSLLDWIHDTPLPAPTENQDILKEYYEKEIHRWIRFKFEYQDMCLRSHFLVTNYPLPCFFELEGDV